MSDPKNISYLSTCFRNNRLIRWPDEIMPITIFVAPFRWYKAKNDEQDYYNMILEAIKIWEVASEGRVKFKFVHKLYDSQINIEWKRAERKSLGHCNFNFDMTGRLFSAEVNIGLSDGLIHHKYQDKNEVFHTITHEIGHALGLHHSPYSDDIMYVPHQYGVVNVSHRDLTTLKWLYSFPYGTTKQEILNHYKVPGSYDLDKLILKLETGVEENSLQEQQPVCDEDQLHYEQRNLADLGRFNISMQNINVSQDAKEYFKKLKINKDLGK